MVSAAVLVVVVVVVALSLAETLGMELIMAIVEESAASTKSAAECFGERCFSSKNSLMTMFSMIKSLK